MGDWERSIAELSKGKLCTIGYCSFCGFLLLLGLWMQRLDMKLFLVIAVLQLFGGKEVNGFKSFSRYSLVPFADDLAWDSQLDDDFGWHADNEFMRIPDRNPPTNVDQKKVEVSSEQVPTTAIEVTSMKQDVTVDTTHKTEGRVHTPQFHDACKRMFCRIGRTCKISPEGRAECLCAEAGYCNNHRKEVCGSDGLLYPSHCELHRVACLQKKHVGIDHTGKRCANGTLYSVTLSSSSVERSTKRSLLTTPMYSTAGKLQYETTCTERAYNRLKNNLIHYHCARLGETDCFFNHSKKKFVVGSTFGYYDANGNNLLEREELIAIEHLDHLDRLSRTCHLADLLTYDDLDHEVNGTISKTEFFIAFKVVEPILEDNLRIFTTFVSTGNSVELKCGVHGASEVIWKRRGHVIDDSVSSDIKILDDGSLYIDQLGLFHMGNYTCHGSANEHIVQTHVLFVQMVPVVRIHPLTQFHLPGATATIKCHADGVPQPEVSWEKNESPFLQGMQKEKRYVLMNNNSTLEIRSVSYKIDTGAYKCIAKNTAGISHDIGTVVVESPTVPVHYSSELKQVELFAVFHDSGYTVYELNHCHIQHQVAGNFPLLPSHVKQEKFGGDEPFAREEFLCPLNKTCSWSDAINVRDAFIYVTQPDLHQILVIEITNRMNPVEVIKTDKALFPVKLQYVQGLDQVWVTSLMSAEDHFGLKVIQVITEASRNISHKLTSLKDTNQIQNIFLPANDNLKNRFHYGYVHHKEQMALHRIDLLSMATVHVLDLTKYQCVPDAVTFLSLGGYVLVNCEGSSVTNGSFHLVVDYLTDAVLLRSDVGGRFFLSPDVRHLVIVGNRTLFVYTITADGQMEHVFDRFTSFDVSGLSFLPSKSGVGFGIFAISKSAPNVIHFDLASRKLTVVEDVEVSSVDLSWSQKSAIVVGSGTFAEHLLVSSEKSVIAIDGVRRHLHCKWQNVIRGYVIVSFSSDHF